MLNRPAYSHRDIQTRPNRCPRLADLVVLVDKTQINRRPGRRRRSTETIRQIPNKPEILPAAYTGPAGDNYPGAL